MAAGGCWDCLDSLDLFLFLVYVVGIHVLLALLEYFFHIECGHGFWSGIAVFLFFLGAKLRSTLATRLVDLGVIRTYLQRIDIAGG